MRTAVGVAVAVLAVSVVLGIGITRMLDELFPSNVATCPTMDSDDRVQMEDDVKLDLHRSDHGAWEVKCMLDPSH